MSSNKPLNQELIETLRTIRCLVARSPDELVDYFHDSIVSALSKGKTLSKWMGYIYKAVEGRLRVGREVKVYAPLEESIVPESVSVSPELQLDIKRAVASLSPLRRAFIFEYYFEGYTLEEIAGRYKVTNPYVYKVIQKGLDDLRVVFSNKKESTNLEEGY